MIRDLNQRAVDLIKSFEGFRAKAYRDVVGVLTIGYGHTGKDVTPGMEITHERGEEILREDLAKFCDGVERLSRVSLNDNQFGALVSFAFNVGLGALGKSTLLRKLNTGDYQGAAEQFARWNKAGGKVFKGLTRRREAERELFLA